MSLIDGKSTTKTWVVGRRFGAAAFVSMALMLTACGDKDGSGPPTTEPREEPIPGAAQGELSELSLPGTANLEGQLLEEALFTFEPEYIEIDRLNGGTSANFGDANLFQFTGTDAQLAACVTPNGADPADGTCDARLPASNLPFCMSPMQAAACQCTGDVMLDTPTCVEVEFIDWNELLTDSMGAPDEASLATHRLLDAVKLDPSSFKNGACVTTTNVLGKMDITAAAVSNNAEYAYLALKRFDNNGDAGYSWIFNAVAPFEQPAPHGCAQGAPLIYTLTLGDILIKGDFNPSSGAELIVRRATAAADGNQYLATEVVDSSFLDGGLPIWEVVVGTDNLAAVNTTETSAGVLETIMGIDQAGNRTDKNAVSGSPGAYVYGPNIFAEAAVELAVFLGDDGAACDAEFFGSVITQPSTSETADLKDRLGPQLFNFGATSVEAEVSASCEKALEYEVSHVTAPGIDTDDPDSIAAISCEWTFTNGMAEKTATDCTGTLQFDPGDPEGDWQADLEVTVDSIISCTSSQTVGAVGVFEELTADADLAPSCGLSFDYTGSFSGGSPEATPQWTFSGPGDVVPETSMDQNGSATVSTQGTYTGVLEISDPRGSLNCTASAEDTVEIGEELSVTPTLTPTCELSFGYDATINGALGTPTIEWTFSGPGTPTPAMSSSQSGSVDVDANGTYTGEITVSEMRGESLCEASASAMVDAFAPLMVEATLEETCALSFDYSSSVSGGSGGVTYDWQFSGPGMVTPATSSSDSGNATVSTDGVYTGMLTVTDTRTDIVCTDDDSDTAEVFSPLGAEATMTAICDLSFDYLGTINGGSPAAVGSWTFSGLMAPPAGQLSGNQSVPSAGLYTGTFYVSDVLPNGVLCETSAMASANPYAPIHVDITPGPDSLSCPAFGPSDAITYTAHVVGGDGNYSYTWTGCDPLNGSCVVDPDDNDFCADASVYVMVDDGSEICPPDTSETETYTKVTMVNSSNNP